MLGYRSIIIFETSIIIILKKYKKKSLTLEIKKQNEVISSFLSEKIIDTYQSFKLTSLYAKKQL